MTALATGTFEKNLAVLARTSPEAVRALIDAAPRTDVRFFDAADGHSTAEVGEGPLRRLLASRHRPLDEAGRLVGETDLTDAAVYVVSGFGVGHHVQMLSRRLGKTGVVVVFEPDVALLRAVFENIDCAWLAGSNVAVVTDAADQSTVARLTDGIEGLVAMGVKLIEHPASRPHIGALGKQFHDRLTEVVKAVKMTVVTTMVQVKTTLRNLTQNLDRYVENSGIADLKDCAKGRPAIVVSAGPSLARNIDLLARPGIADRFEIIAVQTVLKTLLARGIRPRFVTALDYSEISRRFYEGLTAADLNGVTLVVDPKVNPAVLEAWPRGASLRVMGDRYLEKLLGPQLGRSEADRAALKPGATVAHLAFYLARHIGCDPVAVIGQDLGFTDGQYYAAGAAIHNTWACELNEFGTLEMKEWERIFRMGRQLRKAEDVLGRPIYTDEQMATYLVQFERDFAEDARAGLTVVDATEGGVRKRSAQVCSLHEFIERHGVPNVEGASSATNTPSLSAGRTDTSSAAEAKEARRRSLGSGVQAVKDDSLARRVAEVRAQAARVAEISRKSETFLIEMEEHHGDRARVDRLIGRLDKLRDEVVKIEPAMSLAHLLNQAGAFNRVRMDRAIQLENADGRLTPIERQRRQISRDRENVRLLAEAAGTLGELLDDTSSMLRGGERVVRDKHQTRSDSKGLSSDAKTPSVGVVILVDSARAELAAGLDDHRGVLSATLARVGECRVPGGVSAAPPIVIVTDDVERVRCWISAASVEIVSAPSAFAPKHAAVRAARLLSGECWRGGVAGLTVFDEVFDSRAVKAAMEFAKLDAALLVGPDWCALDPSLCDRVIERFLDNVRAGRSRIAFSQAAPGLCGCVLSRGLVEDLCRAEEAGATTFASIGGVLGYVPSSPIVDLIGLPECVAVDTAFRDCGQRLIADSARGLRSVKRWSSASGDKRSGDAEPRELVMHLINRDGGWIEPERAVAAIANFARHSVEASGVHGGTVTLRSPGALDNHDVLDHPSLRAIVDQARRHRLGVHMRTPLRAERVDAPWLLASADIISVDLLAETAEVYRAVTGRDGFERTRTRLEQLIEARAQTGEPTKGWPLPWIVPRITRCDASYGEIESFHRRWLARCGWAVIDPRESERDGGASERIAPLPVPDWVREKWATQRTIVE